MFYRGRVYFVRDSDMWAVVDPKSGNRLIDRERLGTGGQAFASPIAAVNKLGENVHATPTIAGRALYVRSVEHLWAFGEKQPVKP